jgi:hypothetical protein
MDKFTQINLVLKDYFELNTSVKKIPAKDLMPYFVLAGIFKKDQKNGLPIRNLITKLDENRQLNLIPYLFADRKTVYTKWYFLSAKHSLSKIIKIQNTILKRKSNKKKKL